MGSARGCAAGKVVAPSTRGAGGSDGNGYDTTGERILPFNTYVALYNKDGHEIAPAFGAGAGSAENYDYFTANGESVFDSDGVISPDAPIYLVYDSSGYVRIYPKIYETIIVAIKPIDEYKRFMHGIYEGQGVVEPDGAICFSLQRLVQ